MLSNEQTELRLACQLGKVLTAGHWMCAVAESCTGGRLAAAITDIAGSSKWFDRGFITYSNQAKMDMLGVRQDNLTVNGAVSEEVVCAMAEGALSASSADLTVAISGIAGPGGGGIEKPVGLVWLAWAGRPFKTEAQSYHFKGDRLSIRSQAVCVALDGLCRLGKRLK
jgi:nicotinamide-nucleotide amidase